MKSGSNIYKSISKSHLLSCSGAPFNCSLPIQMVRVKQSSIEEPSGGMGPTAKEEALAREREERFSKLSAWKVRTLMDVDVHSDHVF